MNEINFSCRRDRDIKNELATSEYDAWLRREVQIGLDAANAGRLVSAADVEARLAARRAATCRKLL